jgi:AcrR family transcriptional regulator
MTPIRCFARAGAIIRTVSTSTPYAAAARELLRNSLLDAAVDELQRRSWNQVTMADVASAAGVSRQTLYKEFGSRSEFVQALVLREVDRFIDPVAQVIALHGEDPSGALTAGLGVFLNKAATHPLIHTILTSDSTDEFLRLFTTRGSPVLARAVSRLTEILLEGWPQVDRTDVEAFAECMVRLAVSLAALPYSPSGITAQTISDLFTPYVERILAQTD